MKTLLFLLAALLPSAQSAAAEVENAIRELAYKDFSTSAATAARRRSAIAVIRRAGRASAPEAMPILLMHVRSDRAWPVWQDALAAACAMARPADVPNIVAVLREQLDGNAALRRGTAPPTSRAAFKRAPDMCWFFVEKCIPLLPDDSRTSADLIEILGDMAVPFERGWQIAGEPTKAALRLLPDEESRALHLVQYVRRKGMDGYYDDRWGGLTTIGRRMNQAIRAGLRAVVNEDLRNERAVNREAVGILADAGDLTMLPVLLSVQHTQPSPQVAELIRCIQYQNPPEQLLDCIAAAESPIDRLWALERAIELGLSRSAILDAVQTYVRRNIDSVEWRRQAVHLKSTAVRFGLIAATELSTIPYFTRLGGEQDQGNKKVAIEYWTVTGPNHTIPPSCEFIPYDFETPATVHEPPPGNAPFGQGDSGAWKPNRANFERLFEWYRMQNWRGVPPQEQTRRISLKACELDLLHPDRCATLATTQPVTP